jgi:hypothetical protein
VSARVRRASLVLAAVIGFLFPLPVHAQTNFTTKAIKEFDNALTSAGRFGVPRYATASLPTCFSPNRGAVAFDTSTLTLKTCTGVAWVEAGGASTSGTNTWTGTQNFVDTSFFIVDDGDQTKKVAFQVSGITTGTTRTFTLPNATSTICVASVDCVPTSSWNWQPQAFIGIGGSGNTHNQIVENINQTPDTGMLMTGSLGNSWVIAETADLSFDFAHAAQTDPTLFIHSHNQNTTQWISFYHDGTNALINTGAGILGFQANGNTRVGVDNGGITLSNNFVAWGTNFTSQDVFLAREAAATLQMGVDVNGAAVAQTLKAHDGITGTDVAGANFTLAAGRGTGAGTGGNLILQAAPALGTGTTGQTLSTRQLIVGKQKSLSTTSATTTTFLQIGGLGAHGAASGTVEFGIRITDGTNDQALSGIMRWSFVDTTAGAGGETCGAAVIGTVDATAANGGAASSGTASAVAATTTGTDVCNIQITPTFSLTATVVEITYTVKSQSKTATLTPQ